MKIVLSFGKHFTKKGAGKFRKQTQFRFYSKYSPVNLFPKQPETFLEPCQLYLPIKDARLLLAAPEDLSGPIHGQDLGLVETEGAPLTEITTPTGPLEGEPEGRKKKISPKEKNLNNINATIAENESAAILAKAGYRVRQLPENNEPGEPNPDYEIEGKRFDCKTAFTKRARNVADTLKQSVEDGQADRFVLNLDHSDLTLEDMRAQLTTYPVTGLKEVIAIKHGNIAHIFP